MRKFDRSLAPACLRGMSRRLGSVAAALLLASSTSACLHAHGATGADPVIEAERRFAADAIRLGRNAAFLAHVADEAVALTPEPEPAKARLARNPNRVGPPHLRWWPIWAGISVSGDFGFTTGPWVYGDGQAHGYYFTVWRKQPDGAWKWILDHGPPSPSPSRFAETTPVVRTASGARGAGGELAAAELQRFETETLHVHGRTAALSQKLLAADARVMGMIDHPAVGRSAAASAIAARPESLRHEHRGATASKAGDLALTYGTVAWTDGGAPSRGSYVRVWRRRGPRWELLFDEVVPARERG